MSEPEQTKDQLLSYIHRSQYALYWLAAEPEVQVAYLNEYTFSVDELLEQFHDYYNPEFTGVALLLTPEQRAALARVFSLFPWNKEELLEIRHSRGQRGLKYEIPPEALSKPLAFGGVQACSTR